MLDNAYVAGFFDGEGCIVLTKNGQCKVYVSQSDPDILFLIQAQFGGCIQKNAATLGKESHNLRFSKKEEMLKFLLAIQPHCFVKKHKVDIAIKFVELTQSNQKRKQAANGHFLPAGNLPERDQLRSMFYCKN